MAQRKEGKAAVMRIRNNKFIYTERDFRATVEEAAKLLGWRVYHTWNSLHSAAGFPDLVMLRRERMVVAELKSQSGKFSDEQVAWLEAFEEVPHVEVFSWRPSSWPQIERVLK